MIEREGRVLQLIILDWLNTELCSGLTERLLNTGHPAPAPAGIFVL